MRKTKMIMLALVIALVAMGAGYASWVQQFEVTADVDTGELDISTHMYPQDFIETYEIPEYDNAIYPLGDAPYMEATGGNVENDDLTFDVTNIYPGAYIYFEAITTNDGTMAIELEDINITSVNSELLEQLDLKYRYYIWEGSWPWKYVGIFDSIDELVAASLEEEIEPGQRSAIGVLGQFNMDLEADEFENELATFTMDVTYGQFNQ